MKCHPNLEVLEFYSKESTSENYRYLPKGKVRLPVFAFAFPKNKTDSFEVEPCHESWGYQTRHRFKDGQEVRKIVFGNFG